MMRLSESLRQNGIGHGPSFSDHQLGFDPAAAQLKRRLDIAQTQGKVTRRDTEAGCNDSLVQGQVDLSRSDGS